VKKGAGIHHLYGVMMIVHKRTLLKEHPLHFTGNLRKKSEKRCSGGKFMTCSTCGVLKHLRYTFA
jgi:hypothetical protein